MKLRVFNVGQADSFELVPFDGCKFKDNSIVVDCGNESKNIFNSLSNSPITGVKEALMKKS
jgi:hypothetical protein